MPQVLSLPTMQESAPQFAQQVPVFSANVHIASVPDGHAVPVGAAIIEVNA